MTNVVSTQPNRPTEHARPSAQVAHGTGEARPWHNPAHPMKSGENLGPYRLLERIGEGGPAPAREAHASYGERLAEAQHTRTR